MTVASEIAARVNRLPRALTQDVVCEPDLRVPAGDGAALLADRWVARAARDRPQPTVLVRSPYGRKRWVGLLFGRLLAERGLQVVIQSTRGTFGSEGDFSPFDERADGLATLRWLREQPWHAGRIGMFGPSYLGLVQWAVAPDAGEDLVALAIQASASQFHGQSYAGGSLSLETAASWLAMVAAQERRFPLLAILRAVRGLPGAIAPDEPIAELDVRAAGEEVAWYREALQSTAREDPYWVARDFAGGVEKVDARVQLVGGWYDIFLPWMLEDFAALQAAGRQPQLVIGPWSHTAPGMMGAGLRNGIAWLRAALLDDPRMVREAPVRIFVTGEGGGWRTLETWPPPDTGERRLFLAAGGALAEAPGEDGADGYRYDPRDPTPSLGGPVLLAREPVVDNAPLEARDDVLTYTTDPLPATVEAVGPVRVTLHARADPPNFDLFARVCDVDAEGVSRNVCDALVRVGEPGAVTFELWPAAHRFAAGHRIRLQVSSGAHPRYARNPGTGEDPVRATGVRPVDVEILHGAGHPSVLVLAQASDASTAAL